MNQRAIYDPATKSFKGSAREIRIMPASDKMRAYDNALMNGSPFGPFDEKQPINGKPYKEPSAKSTKK